MGRLTTIEDVEKKSAAQDDEQMRAAQEVMLNARAKSDVQAQSASPARDNTLSADASQASRQKAERTPEAPVSKSQAQQEVDFHGLDNLEKKSGGHVALIAIAIVIVVVAALKIANVF